MRLPATKRHHLLTLNINRYGRMNATMQSNPAVRSSDLNYSCPLSESADCESIAYKSFLIPALISLISFVLFAVASPRALPNGDAALYLQQILALDISQRTTHIGYYLVGIPFIHFLPFEPDYSLHLMSCLCGALCASLLFAITAFITRSRFISLLACFILVTTNVFAHNAVFAEVYMPQLLFFLLALHLLQRNSPIAGGASYALSFLITPSALFGLAMLFPFRRNKKQLPRFIAAFLLLTIIIVVPHLSDYVSGGRGLLKASHAAMSADKAFVKEYREFFAGILWYLPFLLAGCIDFMKNKMTRDWGIALFSMWLITFAAGERFGDVPVQLPAYAFICVIAASGMKALLYASRHKSRVLAAIVCLYCLLALTVSGGITGKHISMTAYRLAEYRKSILALKQAARPDFLAAGEWTQGILFEHYLYGASYTGLWLNTECLAGEWGSRMREESEEKLQQALLSGREIWLLNYDTVLFSRLTERGYLIEPFQSIYRATRKDAGGSRLTALLPEKPLAV